jgi:hypothetical protein
MKRTTKLFLTAAMAVGFTFSNNVLAGDALLSPRAKDHRIGTVTVTTESQLERGLPAGTPRGREQAESLRKVAGKTENKIDRSFVTASPKMREIVGPGTKEFQVAPVK